MNLPFPQNAGHCLSAEEILTTTALKTTYTELKMTPFHENPYLLQMEFQNVAHKISDSISCTSMQLLWPVYSFIKWSTLQHRSISELFDTFEWNSPIYTYKTVQRFARWYSLTDRNDLHKRHSFFLCKECLNIRLLRPIDSNTANVDSRQESSKHVKTIGRKAVPK
jgi:hypothetical protein